MAEQPNELLDYMVSLRRAFHVWPELGYQEFRTAERIEKELLSFGLKPETGIAETGMVVVIEGERSGLTIMFRADMDGLGQNEVADAEYKSQNPGVMHACGHDGHMAIHLAFARTLASSTYRAAMKGKVMLLFQPAEEGGGGAKKMIKEGVLKKYKPDQVYSLHIENGLDVGAVGVRAGFQQAASRRFSITFRGPGGHAGRLYETHDVIKPARKFCDELDSLGRELLESFFYEPPIVHVGEFHAGTAQNIVASEAIVRGTIRAHDIKHVDKIEDEIAEIAIGIAKLKHLPRPEMHFTKGYIPVINNPDAVALVKRVALHELGIKTTEIAPSGTADDISFFLDQVPGCHFKVGSRNAGKGFTAQQHSPKFDFDEDALLVGYKMYMGICKELLLV